MNPLNYLMSLNHCDSCDTLTVSEECTVCGENECKSCKDSYGCLEMAWND